MLRVFENKMIKWERCFKFSLNFIILQDMVFVVSLCVFLSNKYWSTWLIFIKLSIILEGSYYYHLINYKLIVCGHFCVLHGETWNLCLFFYYTKKGNEIMQHGTCQISYVTDCNCSHCVKTLEQHFSEVMFYKFWAAETHTPWNCLWSFDM
jgi:hypothetical protein